MTPEQKIKHAILARSAEMDGKSLDIAVSPQSIEASYDELCNEEGDWNWDAIEEVRCSGVETGLPCDSSRHYEADAVAAQMPDGTWVGWTYWYGGGKHGEPQEMDWMDDAYDLTCVEEEKIVIVRTFTKAPLTAA